jgi:hypothetical protein
MSAFSSDHAACHQLIASQRVRCRAALMAMGHGLSRIDDDNRMFTGAVVVVGFLPCALLAFALFGR